MDRIIRLKELLEKEPEDSFLQHALGLEYTKIGKFDEALSMFEKLLKEKEDYIPSYYHLAKLLVEQNKIEKAIEIAESADIFVVIGTSLVVYPAAGLIHYIKPTIPKFIIDKTIPYSSVYNITAIEKPATQGIIDFIDIMKQFTA